MVTCTHCGKDLKREAFCNNAERMKHKRKLNPIPTRTEPIITAKPTTFDKGVTSPMEPKEPKEDSIELKHEPDYYKKDLEKTEDFGMCQVVYPKQCTFDAVGKFYVDEYEATVALCQKHKDQLD